MLNSSHIVAPIEGTYTHTIIFLHGRDSIAPEFAEELFESQASDNRTLREKFPTVKWIFPGSKFRDSARFDTQMSQWFDIWSVENPLEREEIQKEGLQESVGEIIDIIRKEASLIPPEQIILGGISQGCATAIYALLCGGIRFGGFVGLCSWMPFQNDIAALSKSEGDNAAKLIRDFLNEGVDRPARVRDLSHLSQNPALETPIFLSHSQDDSVVPISNGEELSRLLAGLGLSVIWKSYEDGGHWINEPQGLDDIVYFLQDECGLK